MIHYERVLLKQEQDYVIKRLLTIIAILVGVAMNSYSQRSQPIMYLVPDTIKAKIEIYLKEKSNESAFILLGRSKDTTTIIVSSYSDADKEFKYLIQNSNRFINVGSQAISVILQEDLALSDRLHTIKNKGTPNETMKVTELHVSGYLIVYKGLYWDISILRSKYYRY